ncbi:DUF885 domain-containing protein [Undibacterium sp. Jales W-56]|uniref:DUF885 domain-containing protein n=1 Tax=Undibacterium sp. Jales W-56 TaxID=2897325 RepID=UPI0021D11D4B|nr:DUF885 domain-containing protein [Undibacterium sp. Jales W-56]MCU6435493.1 DUF885 domain-containing protein [Undibacterium sp. Jales W-56]
MRKPVSLATLVLSLGLLGSSFALAPLVFAHPNDVAGNAAVVNLAGKRLNTLAENYYNQAARFEPLMATSNGDNRFDDQLPMTLVPAVRARQVAMYRQVAKELASIHRSTLSAADQVTYDCLDYDVRSALAMFAFKDRLMPLNQMDSIPVVLANFASGQSSQPLQTPAQYEMYLKRVAQLPAWIDQAIINMREGMRQGIVLPRALVVSTLPQLQTLVTDNAENHAYYAPVKKFPASFSEADKTRLTTAYRNTIAHTALPALRKLHAFMQRDYLAASRSSSGLGVLPDGAKWYQALVRDQTTTTLDPETIHAIGLKEVARIQNEFVLLGPQLGYNGDPKGLPAWIDTQTQYRPFSTEAEILAEYRRIDGIIKGKLPELFGKIPKAPLDIRPEPEISRKTASDHYSAPAIDGSRPGVFWAVINDPKHYSTTGMTTLFLHEGQPGHHFHLAFLQELDIPKFRKFGGNNAYTEGWALYAETLGKEMGVFEDPNAYLGHLTDELLRASRLVVDTGLHAKGWTREETIKYLQATLGYDEATARNATERYMAWPAQALGYKIGSLKIMELRQRAMNQLGAKFNLRHFHDAILSDGTLPLALLEAKIDKWIIEQQKL